MKNIKYLFLFAVLSSSSAMYAGGNGGHTGLENALTVELQQLKAAISTSDLMISEAEGIQIIKKSAKVSETKESKSFSIDWESEVVKFSDEDATFDDVNEMAATLEVAE